MQFLLNIYTTYAFQILTVLWIFAIARSILFWLHYIQLKQYRIDRLLSELNHQKFYRLVFSSYRSILIGFFLAWQLLLRTSVSSEVGAFDALLTAIILFFLFHTAQTLKHVKNHRLQIPTFTPKIWIIFVSLLAIEIVIASWYQFWPEQLLAFEILQPIIVLFIFSLLFIPNFLLQRKHMQKAREKRLMHRDLTVIGITGSYGKTSMKELLAHILSTKFNVLKTPKHINVDTGIANLVLEKLNPEHEILIVEMGAYRKGEIGRICNIVLPNYAVMTGLTNQHLELFGSLEFIEKAKFELVEAVGEPDHIVANAESPKLMEAFKSRSIEPITYGFSQDARYSASDLVFSKAGLELTLAENKVSVPIYGRANAINVLGAIALSRQLGMNMKEIQDALRSFPQIERTMEVKTNSSDSWVIDDSYNANVASIMMTFDDLAQLSEKRILIFKNVIELADQSESEHKKIAKRAAELFDAVLLLPSPQRNLMRTTMLEAGFNEDQILHPNDSDKLAQLFRAEPTVVLCEGRESEQFIDLLLKE